MTTVCCGQMGDWFDSLFQICTPIQTPVPGGGAAHHSTGGAQRPEVYTKHADDESYPLEYHSAILRANGGMKNTWHRKIMEAGRKSESVHRSSTQTSPTTGSLFSIHPPAAGSPEASHNLSPVGPARLPGSTDHRDIDYIPPPTFRDPVKAVGAYSGYFDFKPPEKITNRALGVQLHSGTEHVSFLLASDPEDAPPGQIRNFQAMMHPTKMVTPGLEELSRNVALRHPDARHRRIAHRFDWPVALTSEEQFSLHEAVNRFVVDTGAVPVSSLDLARYYC